MIYRFEPILKGTPWGGNRICLMKGLAQSDGPIGESWELSAADGCNSVVESGPESGLTLGELVARNGEALLGSRCVARYGLKFPIMLKFIDACQWLSLQVHPDGEIATRLEGSPQLGKTEMWHIIDSAPGAELIIGFREGIGPEDYAAAEGSEDVLALAERHPALPGSDFYIEAGTVHALGAGCFVAEVALNCELTYRLYDYGRCRPLHFSKGMSALKFNAAKEYGGPVDAFKVETLSYAAGSNTRLKAKNGSFQAVMVLKGHCRIDGVDAPAGRTLLISADHGDSEVCCLKQTEILVISI